MQITTLLIILGIAQGLFLGMILITIRRGNRRANLVMGTLIILFAVSISHFAFLKTNVYEIYPHLYKTAQPLLFLFGPLFLLYVRIHTERNFRFHASFLLHFIPFVLFIIYLLPVYTMPASEKIGYIRSASDSVTVFDYLIMPLQVIHIFIYMWIVDRKIDRNTARLKESFSSIERINLAWLKRSTVGFVGVFVVIAVLIVLKISGFDYFVSQFGQDLIAIIVAVVIYYIGYKGLRQPEIFIGENDPDQVKKYEKSTLQRDAALIYKNKLLEYMREEKPFSDAQLTIKELAQKTRIPAYHLSQVINEQFGKNFFDFINSYRIEEAKMQLSDPKNDYLSIQAIAFEVGFNSKSAFNNAFNKFAGITPSQFRTNRNTIKNASQ